MNKPALIAIFALAALAIGAQHKTQHLAATQPCEVGAAPGLGTTQLETDQWTIRSFAATLDTRAPIEACPGKADTPAKVRAVHRYAKTLLRQWS
jgi:hypothetical protein